VLPVESRIFLTHVHSGPFADESIGISPRLWRRRKLNFIGSIQRYLRDDKFSRFDRTPAYNGQTDRQTHGNGI